MRTTIDLPEDLLRLLKAKAALEGVKLKDLVAEILREGINQKGPSQAHKGQRRPLPFILEHRGTYVIPSLTNAEIEALEEEEAV